jgi:hypothetical protein
MPPMRIPAPAKDEELRSTVSIDTYARQHQLTPREVRRLLGTGKLPFVQVRGQIRVQLEPRAESSIVEAADEN